MNEPATPATPRDSLLTEGLLRAFAVLLLAWFITNVLLTWKAQPERYTLLLLIVSETITLGLVLAARRAWVRDLSPAAVGATLYAMFYFVLLGYVDTRHFAPEAFGAVLQLLGLGWQLGAKLFLGRSFGLLPATRGLVTAGPYRLVRHPIYLGYLVSHVGFLATNFSWRNAAVLAVLYLAQVVRMLREEAVLAEGELGAAYRTYRERVRWRLLPGVF